MIPERVANAVLEADSARGGGRGTGATVAPTVCLTETARYFGVSKLDLRSHSRRAHLVWMRHVGYYVARSITSASYPAIGLVFRRDHSTIMYGVSKVRSILAGEGDLDGEARERAAQHVDAVSREVLATVERLAALRRRDHAKAHLMPAKLYGARWAGDAVCDRIEEARWREEART